MAAKVYFERRSVLTSLETFLASKGWTGLNYKEGFQSDDPIDKPLVAIQFVRPQAAPLQLGAGDKLFTRVIQIDCYMEAEARALAINDDIMEFMDDTAVAIVDNNSANLGSIICQNTTSIFSEVMPPILTDPKVVRWRGITRGTWEAYYPN